MKSEGISISFAVHEGQDVTNDNDDGDGKVNKMQTKDENYSQSGDAIDRTQKLKLQKIEEET